ncbi:uncharacterized protein LOC143151430, partial [Ptiloglossa arizonensis]|uniref:uncharacterized protein LOC143151430 n=1 Tax=Ptiloglossa arizonensis TaxID=3350558 RepID=UPI003F9F39AA
RYGCTWFEQPEKKTSSEAGHNSEFGCSVRIIAAVAEVLNYNLDVLVIDRTSIYCHRSILCVELANKFRMALNKQELNAVGTENPYQLNKIRKSLKVSSYNYLQGH